MNAVSQNVPNNLPHLQRTWERDPTAPVVQGRPRYRTCDHDFPLVHIFWHGGVWYMGDASALDVLLYAVSTSDALHPCTILPGEWCVMVTWHTEWVLLEQFHIACISPLKACSRECPADLDDVGHDVFLRIQLKHPFWYVDPCTQEVVFSGSKATPASPPGKRFCALCNKAFSSNNFVTQHMRLKHPHLRPVNLDKSS